MRLLREARTRGATRGEVTAEADARSLDEHGDVPFRPASTLEVAWRSARFPLSDYAFATWTHAVSPLVQGFPRPEDEGMPDLPGMGLVHDWESAMRGIAEAAVARERRVQRELMQRAYAPVDATFELLETSGIAMREEAEALEHAAEALQHAAQLMKAQAEAYEAAVRTFRSPARKVESVFGLDGTPPRPERQAR